MNGGVGGGGVSVGGVGGDGGARFAATVVAEIQRSRAEGDSDSDSGDGGGGVRGNSGSGGGVHSDSGGGGRGSRWRRWRTLTVPRPAVPFLLQQVRVHARRSEHKRFRIAGDGNSHARTLSLASTQPVTPPLTHHHRPYRRARLRRRY